MRFPLGCLVVMLGYGCGANLPGGGGVASKPVGTNCTTSGTQGCNTQNGVVSRMTCSNGVWTMLQDCPTGDTCAESTIGTMTSTSCKEPAAQPTDVMTVAQAWPAAFACMKSHCPSQWSACSADPTCANAFICINNCTSSSDFTACAGSCATATAKADSHINALFDCGSSVCASITACGDGQCNPGETHSNCPVDCKTVVSNPDAGGSTDTGSEQAGTCDSFSDIKATATYLTGSDATLMPVVLNKCLANGSCSSAGCVASCISSSIAGLGITSQGCRTCVGVIAVCGAQACPSECGAGTATECGNCIAAACGDVGAVCKITWAK